MLQSSSCMSPAGRCFPAALLHRLSARLAGRGQAVLSAAGGGQPGGARRQNRRLAAHRAAVQRRRVFSAAAIGGLLQRRRVRRDELERQQLSAARPRRPAAWTDRQVCRPAGKKGKPVGPDIESWFQKDQLGGKPGIVSQWANLHNASAQNWIKSDMTNGKYGLCGQYVQDWQKSHKTDVDALDQGQSGHARAEAGRPGRAVLRQLLEGPSGHVPQRGGTQDGRRQDGEGDRAGQGGQRHPDRSSSICGSASTRTLTCEKCPPTW